MFEEIPGGITSEVELDLLLLDAKLSVPEPPARGSVSRAALIDSARSSERRVVGVTAPAGYGKSTLLTEWAHAEERPVGWVSLDRFDDDPGALLTLLASAFARITPGMDHLPVDVRGHGFSALGRAAPLLASAFRASPAPFVLMLDDLHEIRSPACQDVLSIVLAGVPHGSQVVAASRAEQPHLPRLRASGDALEITASELALDAAGARQIFAEAQVSLSADDAAEVVERTEGWPVGLFLAAAIARDSGDDPLSVSGDDRYVADYLYRESLAKLTEQQQRFLRRTAVLDRFSASLCDALLGSSDAQEMLRELEASNVFLVPLDRHREWYRYHSLFREFLLGELRRVEPDAIADLHLEAADWFEENGSPAMAIEHLLDNSTERIRATHLVATVALATYQAGQLTTLQRWFSALGDPAIAAYPPLAVLAGWISALTGHTDDADRWAAVLEAASYDGTPADGSASFASARAMLRAMMCADGPERALADAGFAVAAEPTWSPWRDQAFALLGEALLLAGDADQAEAAFAECSVTAAARDSSVLVVSESELAVMAMDHGRWAEAADHVQTALATIEQHRMHDYATAVLAFAEAARLAVHRGDLVDAHRQLTRAMRARPTCTYAIPFIAVRVRLQLAKVYWTLADHATARHLLREADDILLYRPALGTLVDDVSDFREFVSSIEHPGSAGGPPLTPAELRLLPYLQTHLSIREIGDRLFVSRNTVSSEVGSIYRKLGVSARSEAVERAMALGLLGA
ncbi:LuxR C-terminal-related transcriptional regulator [Agromyces sp. Soil535]|uniref:LuxR C-terminal-related transcriptional regulator n=1 Tax=Agromyces sp. Soil535 TaxID=1736390 RepID=UPI0006F91862|nr:LuxR C-terminal-related transcriptional regulator [Agromyces sp. Soil535]KRE30809.1 LuxR family transcriptional regulator [Agromyces sp. Soil535]